MNSIGFDGTISDKRDLLKSVAMLDEGGASNAKNFRYVSQSPSVSTERVDHAITETIRQFNEAHSAGNERSLYENYDQQSLGTKKNSPVFETSDELRITFENNDVYIVSTDTNCYVLCENASWNNSNAEHQVGQTPVDINSVEYRYQRPIGKRKKCFVKVTPFMGTVITVLIFIILGLSSGLVYFVTQENDAVKDQKVGQDVIPGSTTILNQTSVCARIPSTYSVNTVNKGKNATGKASTSNVVEQKNGTARLIGGDPVESIENLQSETSADGELPEPLTVQSRIFGGKPTAGVRHPWQVSLWLDGKGMRCGGAVLSERWIITAAHCTDKVTNPYSFTAYMGVTRMSQKENPPAQKSRIMTIIQHPDYVINVSYDFDISLLKLETPIRFSSSVQPICLPSTPREYEEGTQCYISGWGATVNTGQLSSPDILHHAQVDIFGYDTCRQEDWLDYLVTDRMICAGKADGSKDACQGDSGGPLSCYDTERKVYALAGIVSWGIDCGQPKMPGVYTKMTYFTDWVLQKIGENEGPIARSDGR